MVIAYIVMVCTALNINLVVYADHIWDNKDNKSDR